MIREKAGDTLRYRDDMMNLVRSVGETLLWNYMPELQCCAAEVNSIFYFPSSFSFYFFSVCFSLASRFLLASRFRFSLLSRRFAVLRFSVLTPRFRFYELIIYNRR